MTEENTELKDALERLRQVIPHLRTAGQMALEDVGGEGVIELGIIAKNGNEGRVGASFDFEPFIQDLILISGVEDKDPSEQDLAVARILSAVPAGASIVKETLGKPSE